MTEGCAGLVTFQDLQRITGYARRSDIERTLQEQGIHMFYGRSGPWTTLDLINQAGGLADGNQEQYGTEIL